MLGNEITRRATLGCLPIALLLVASANAFAQGTTFTYQGRLTESGDSANGTYDLQFKLFDTATLGTGTQQGATLTLTNITVTAGLFTVQLDFGVCPSCFSGGPRFLEIAVRPTSGPTLTTLDPRQPVTPTPYTIRSQNATSADGLSLACVSCVSSSQIRSVQGIQIIGTIPVASVPAGSTNYIQNTTTQQAATDFNISGSGTVGGTLTGGVVSATIQYNIGGQRVLSMPGAGNLFAGENAGSGNTTGVSNSFFGRDAGAITEAGSSNSFFGREAGVFSRGDNNAFFGRSSGFFNNTGTANTLIGANANVGQNNLTNATAIGYRASVNQNNSLVLGGISGVNSCNAANNCDSVKVGIGTTTPAERLHVAGNGLFTGTLSGNVISATTQYNLATVRMLAANGPFDSGLGLNLSASNTFLGESAGLNTAPNPTLTSGEGKNNSFVGAAAGEDNTTGSSNSLLGVLAGAANTTGIGNSFFGVQAGVGNNTGSFNTAIGLFANVGSNNLTNATAVGARARVDQSNSLVLGGITGINSGTSVNVGIGTTQPSSRLHIRDNNGNILLGHAGCSSGLVGIGFGANLSGCNNYSLLGNGVSTVVSRPVGGTLTFREGNSTQMTIIAGGNVGIGTTAPDQSLTVNGGASKPGGGSWAVFSDLRLKTLRGSFTAGLNEVMRLQPIRYQYKPDNALGIPVSGEQVGFAAQAVERVIPEAVSRNEQGYLLVNNDPIMWAMLNAIKELRSEKDEEIAALKAENDSLKRRLDQMRSQQVLLKQHQIQIESLKKIICRNHPDSEGCR